MELHDDSGRTQRRLGGITAPTDLVREIRLNGSVVCASPRDSAAGRTVAALAESEGWRLVTVAEAESARRASSMQRASLVVVVSCNPHFAVEVVRAVRRTASVPIVVLGEIDAMTRVRVLSDGADVVVPEGLDRFELRSRVVAVLRRSNEAWEPSVRYLMAGELQVDLWSRCASLGGAELPLSPTEFRLLVYLMRYPRRALPRHTIVQRLWGSHEGGYDLNALRIQVSRLRAKISRPGVVRPVIRSVRGIGYEFTAEVVALGDGAGEVNTDNAALLDMPQAILDLVRKMIGRPVTEAAEHLTSALRDAVGADAVAIFGRASNRLDLVAESGNSERWRASMRDGLPMRPGFAQVHAIQKREATLVTDLNGSRRGHRDTARMLAADGYHQCLFVPIVGVTGSWGGLGVASRSQRPYDRAVATFCTAAAGMFSLAVGQERADARSLAVGS